MIEINPSIIQFISFQCFPVSLMVDLVDIDQKKYMNIKDEIQIIANLKIVSEAEEEDE